MKDPVIIEGDCVYIRQAGMKVFVKTADVCSMFGTSNQWVGQLTSQGTINKVKTSHGALYEATETVNRYCVYLKEKKLSDEDTKIEKSKRKAEMQLKASKAAIALLQAQEMQGKMHRSEDVAAMTADLIYTVRSALIALPGRLAVDVAALSTPAECSDRIRREVHLIMRELANYKYDPAKYAERVRERMDWDGTGQADTDDDE